MPFQKGNPYTFQKGHALAKSGDTIIGKVSFENVRMHKTMHSKDAILAKCYDCMGFYEDGTMDCGCKDCPLYPWMPYKEKKEIKKK
jgi:hypothetical protein